MNSFDKKSMESGIKLNGAFLPYASIYVFRTLHTFTIRFSRFLAGVMECKALYPMQLLRREDLISVRKERCSGKKNYSG